MIYFPISPKVVASELYFLHVLPLCFCQEAKQQKLEATELLRILQRRLWENMF